MRWFEWESVLQACLHKHFFIQISIWWNHQASCFHEYGNKKISWLNNNTFFLSCYTIIPHYQRIFETPVRNFTSPRTTARKCFLPQPVPFFPVSGNVGSNITCSYEGASVYHLSYYSFYQCLQNVHGHRKHLSLKALFNPIFFNFCPNIFSS